MSSLGHTVIHGQLLLMLGMGHLVRDARFLEARCCLFVKLQDNLKHETRYTISMDKPLERTWVGPQDGWDSASGNHQGGVSRVNQVDGTPDMASSPASSEGGRLAK